MERFITHIPHQTITIDGKTYTAQEAQAGSGLSLMQTAFRDRQGVGSFWADLADFLAEWFNGDNLVKVHTSGSTGIPKELWVEKRHMMNSAMQTVSFLRLSKNDTALLCMPLRYIAGKMVVVRALVAGLDLIPVSPCGNPLQDLAQAPTFAALTPMQVYNTLQNERQTRLLKEVKQLIIGGGSIDKSMEEALHDFPNNVWSTYGMTETLSHIAMRKLNGEAASDWYTPFEQVSLSRSEEGTLIIHAPHVCDEKLTTNDIVTFNASGQFRIAGRKDNTINTGGIKVQIEEVEKVLQPLLPFPFMITSVPDAKFGECIVLLVNQPGTDAFSKEHNDLVEQAIQHLPAYWKPKQIIPLDELPLTGTGKPDRATAKRIARQKRIF